MRVALVGSSGYIAGYILERMNGEAKIESVLKLDRDDKADCHLDLTEPKEFDYSLLDGIDYIVFTAAISGPDQCANEFEECWKINVTGTSYFIRQALALNCRILFFSSDAVFGDRPGMIYDENSITEAITPYGKMKKAIEDEFCNNPLFKAIRLSYVASANDRFVTYCKNCIRNREVADIFHPFYRNVIVVSDVVDVVLYFAHNWDEYKPTFLNVAGRELVSRVRIADEINRLYNGRLEYSVSMPGADFFTNRPRITQMKSLYLNEYEIIPDMTFSEKIAIELEGMEL